MSRKCFTMAQFMEGIPEDHPHLQQCSDCRRIWEDSLRLRRMMEKEKSQFQEFMEYVRKDKTAGGFLPRVESLPHAERLPWILKQNAASHALALKLAVKGRSVIYHSPAATAQWLALAEGVHEAAKRETGFWENKDALWTSGRLYTIKGSLCLIQGHIKEAHAYYERASELFLEVYDEYNAALLAEGFAQTLTKLGKFREAKRLCLDTLPVLREYGERRNYLRLMNNLSLVLFAMGAVEKALKISSLLIKIHDMDDESLACFLRNQALLLFEMRRFAEVEIILEKIMAISHRSSMDMEIGRSLWLYGEIALEQGAFEKAQADLEKAKRIFQREGDLLDATLCDAYIARVYMQMGRRQKVLETLPGIIDFLTKENILLHIADVLSLWRDALDADDPKAVEIGDQAYRIVSRLDKIPSASAIETALH